MAPAQPPPKPVKVDPLEESGETLEVKAEIRETLAKVRERSKTGRLSEDSNLFRFKQKLTELGSEDDVDRRRKFLKDAGLTTQVDYGEDPLTNGTNGAKNGANGTNGVNGATVD